MDIILCYTFLKYNVHKEMVIHKSIKLYFLQFAGFIQPLETKPYAVKNFVFSAFDRHFHKTLLLKFIFVKDLCTSFHVFTIHRNDSIVKTTVPGSGIKC